MTNRHWTAPFALAFAAALVTAPLAAPAFAMGSDDSTSTTTSGSGSGTDSTKGTKKEDKALQDIEKMLKKGQFEPSIALLKPYTAAHPQDADGWNLLGYASRKAGHIDVAFGYYEKALAINPDHKGALEYMGELYVQTGQLDTARGLLAHLQRLCPQGCIQVSALSNFIKGGSEFAKVNY